MVKGSSLSFGAHYSFFSDAALVAGPPTLSTLCLLCALVTNLVPRALSS